MCRLSYSGEGEGGRGCGPVVWRWETPPETREIQMMTQNYDVGGDALTRSGEG